MKTREELREYHRTWRASNKEKTRAYSRKTYSRMSPEQKQAKSTAARPRHLLRQFGMTEREWNELNDKQSGLCKLCGQPDRKNRWGRLNVDHCHESGRVRGLICTGCNVAIAALGDNEAGLQRALAYVRGE